MTDQDLPTDIREKIDAFRRELTFIICSDGRMEVLRGAEQAIDHLLARSNVSRAVPQEVSEHVKIEHPYRPTEADHEYSDLIRRINSQGGDGVVVGILMQYAFAAPAQGSYAGSLWAIAEWLNERLVIPSLSRPNQP